MQAREQTLFHLDFGLFDLHLGEIVSSDVPVQRVLVEELVFPLGIFAHWMCANEGIIIVSRRMRRVCLPLVTQQVFVETILAVATNLWAFEEFFLDPTNSSLGVSLLHMPLERSLVIEDFLVDCSAAAWHRADQLVIMPPLMYGIDVLLQVLPSAIRAVAAIVCALKGLHLCGHCRRCKPEG